MTQTSVCIRAHPVIPSDSSLPNARPISVWTLPVRIILSLITRPNQSFSRERSSIGILTVVICCSAAVRFLVFHHANSPTRPPSLTRLSPRAAAATVMARGSSNPKLIRSSLAILQERFAVLQCTRERQERKELMMYFSEPDTGRLNGTFVHGLIHRDQTEFSDNHRIDDHRSLERDKVGNPWTDVFFLQRLARGTTKGNSEVSDFAAMPPASKRPRCSTGMPVTLRAPKHTDFVDATLHL